MLIYHLFLNEIITPMRRYIIIFLLCSMGAWGQSPLQLSFHHLTREEGLSNNNIFVMHRDSRGFLWIGTDNGLNRFDGVKCKVYKPTNSGLKGVSIKSIIEDQKGNLWLGTDDGLSFYDRQKDQIAVVKLPTAEPKSLAFPYYVDREGLLWVNLSGFHKAGLYTYHPDKKQFTFVTDQVSALLPEVFAPAFGELKTIYSGGKNNVGINKISLKNNRVVKVEHFFDGTKQPLKSNIGQYIIVENDSVLWQTGDFNGLTRLNMHTGKVEIFNMFEEKPIPYFTRGVRSKNRLLIGSNTGLYVFDLSTKTFVQRIQYTASKPDGLSANWSEVIYLDREGNLFLSQLGFGMDYANLNRVQSAHWLSTDEIVPLGLLDNHVASLFRWRTDSWLNMQSGGIVVVNAQGRFLKRIMDRYGLMADTKEQIWLYAKEGFEIVRPLQKQIVTIPLGIHKDRVGGGMSLVETAPDEYLFSSNGLLEIRKENGRFAITPVADIAAEKFVGCHPMYYDTSSKQVFLSVNWWSGVVVLAKQSGTWKMVHKRMNFPFRVYWYAPSANADSLWFCTNQGLALVNKKTLEYKLFTEKEGLPDNSVNNLVPEANGNYWLVTNRGISHFDQVKKEYRHFTSREGANSKEYDWYGNFLLPDGRAVFGGNNGVTVIDPKANSTYPIKPTVQITALYANEKPLKPATDIAEATEIELQPDQNSFALELAGIEFGFPQKIQLRYQLEGIDPQQIVSSNPAVARYANLREGAYQFRVKATDETGKMSSETRSLRVVIHAPFWRTTWFRAALVVMLIGLGYLFYRFRVNKIRDEIKYREEIRRVKMEAEVMALRSQMNPHFIFNCMNTIDSYIMLNKSSQASDFLQKFSKLIRMILENSRQEFIPIARDLEALELYIQLEQERSNDKFTYEITVDPKLDPQKYLIPPTLFQPFVENAILHGLRHKKGEIGELYINLKIAKDKLIGTVIDNGVGRAAAEKINRFRNHNAHSLGALLTEQRIQKLNDIYPEKAYLKIKDINIDEDTGTIAELGLPLLTFQNTAQHDKGSID